METEDADRLETIQNICNKIVDCTNLLSFAKLDDQQVYSLMKIREISSRVLNDQDTRVTESDLTSAMCFYINRMAGKCKDIVDVLGRISYKGSDDQQVQLLLRMKELLCGIAIGATDLENEPSNPYELNVERPDGEITDTSNEDAQLQVGQSMMDLMVKDEGLEVEAEQINKDGPSHIWKPITWPPNGCITLEWVLDMMRTLEQSSWKNLPSEFRCVMPIDVVDELLSKAASILHKEPNCVKIDCQGEGSKVVVVGDIQGQYHDLLHLFELANFPSENQFYVYSGDYVGRGAWGLEVFLILSAWKVLMPDRVFLLRGNYESRHCTSAYGFEEEVRVKFGEQGEKVYNSCLETFKELPLASIVGGKVYITHGGIFRNGSSTSSQSLENGETQKLDIGSLEELHKIERFLIDAPDEDEDPNILLTDVLWSDPSKEDGLRRNRGRALGLQWGPDCTEAFLKHCNLKMIIRSHEGPYERDGQNDFGDMLSGYSIDHDGESGKLYTLFSAPDYPQFGKKRFNNQGAYAVLKPPDLELPSFHTFKGVDRPKVNAYVIGNEEDEMTSSEDEEVPTSMDGQAVIDGEYSLNETYPTGTNSGVDFEALGILNPPSWSVILTDDETGTQVVHVPKAPVVEGLPLPSNLEEPHKSAYEYFLELIAGLKLMLQKRKKRKRDKIDNL